ncbi:MAG: adenylate kinase [Patescibacteria group bacterium]|nr:adenylate kinase [Patescibacteria group bacterium]
MRNFIIFGPPGAGKGTQAQKIANEFNLHHLSTGALLREEVSRQTEIGQRVQKIMDQGGLVDDSIVDAIVKNKITQDGQVAGFIFDGYPRTINQAENLDALLAAKALPLILNLEVEEKELIKRLKLRGQESGRSDDNEETIKNRLHVYSEQTRPLLDFYARQKRLISVNGQGTIEEVFQLLQDQIK